MRESFHQAAVFRVRQTTSAGSVYQRQFASVAPARVENKIVEKEIVRVRVKLRAKHSGRDCSGKMPMVRMKRGGENSAAAPMGRYCRFVSGALLRAEKCSDQRILPVVCITTNNVMIAITVIDKPVKPCQKNA